MSDAVTREETLLNAIATGETVDIVPVTRKEKYLRYLAGIGEKPSKPITREEMFLDLIQAGGGSSGGGDMPTLPFDNATSFASGTFTVSPINAIHFVEVTHNLGKIPIGVLLFPKKVSDWNDGWRAILGGITRPEQSMRLYYNVESETSQPIFARTSQTYDLSGASNQYFDQVAFGANTETIKIGVPYANASGLLYSYAFSGGIEYAWIVW